MKLFDLRTCTCRVVFAMIHLLPIRCTRRSGQVRNIGSTRCGLKGEESGMVDAWMTHAFTDAVFCRSTSGDADVCDARCGRGSLGYRHANFTAKAGMLSTTWACIAVQTFSVFTNSAHLGCVGFVRVSAQAWTPGLALWAFRGSHHERP